MIPPIHVRFDLVSPHDTDMAGVMWRRQNLWQVPLVGEIVNIGGNPYRVISVGWSLPDMLDASTPMEEGGDDGYLQYAFVKVQKASKFTVTLGGTEY